MLTDGQTTDGRRIPAYTISSPMSFGSSELKRRVGHFLGITIMNLILAMDKRTMLASAVILALLQRYIKFSHDLNLLILQNNVTDV